MGAGRVKLEAALAECAVHAQVLSDALVALPSVEQWRLLREMRTSLPHEYPEHPVLQAAALRRLVGGACELLLFWAAVRAFADRHLAI